MMDFSNPHFESARWLWLAVAGPLLLAWLQWRAAAGRRRQLAQIASPHFIAELTRSHSPGRRVLKNVLLLIAVALTGLALARPQWGKMESHEQWLGEDILFVLDCSRSMTATDVLPSRLQRAKYSIQDFVVRHASGRVGLVAFAGTAFLQCPLTFDHDAFENALRDVDEKSLPVGGTDIGRALQEASHSMEKKSSRKLVVLITDGEDLEKSGVKAAESLAKDGITVYTIGVGTAAGAELQSANATGQMELVRDDKGELVHSHLDEETLTAIAKATGGSYYPLGRLGDGLARVRQTVESPAMGELGRAAAPGVERFHGFVALAIVLMVAESLVGTRRRNLAKNLKQLE
jgi:Ca-activated chloride channel family protein